jgi:hypothetical protein
MKYKCGYDVYKICKNSCVEKNNKIMQRRRRETGEAGKKSE